MDSSRRFTGHIRLLDLFCKESRFEQTSVPERSEDTASRAKIGAGFPIDISMKCYEKDEHHGDVQLTVSIEPDRDANQPYRVSVTYLGRFRFGKLPDGLTREAFLTKNAAAIMFPYVREAVADLTVRGTFGAIHLPPVNVVAMLSREGGEHTQQTALKTDKV